jgi:tRNA(Ile)-lysidine synthase
VDPLTVRSRQVGDAFRPFGLGRRKKLQDFFVDRKIRRSVRDRVPIVVDGKGRIVWVAGYAIGEEFRVIDPTEAVVILRLQDLGGDG